VTVLLPVLRHRDDPDHPDFVSAENLAFAVKQKLGRGSTSYIQQIEWGRTAGSQEVLEAIAEFFGMDPHVFAEYRLARARRLLDAREPAEGGVGLAAAMENYERFAEAVPALSAADAVAHEQLERIRERVLAATDAGSQKRLVREERPGRKPRAQRAPRVRTPRRGASPSPEATG
jgi:hypothetical protein